MTKSKLKEELHKKIDEINDEIILTSIYNLLAVKPKIYGGVLSQKEWDEVQEQSELYKKGKLKTTSREKIRKRAYKALKK